jgi:hypothetical protein
MPGAGLRVFDRVAGRQRLRLSLSKNVYVLMASILPASNPGRSLPPRGRPGRAGNGVLPLRPALTCENHIRSDSLVHRLRAKPAGLFLFQRGNKSLCVHVLE